MSLAVQVLLGLVAGTAAGLALQGAPGLAPALLAVLTPAGTLFVDLIRVTAMPLVVSMLIASIGGTVATGLGRAGARAVLLAVAVLGTIAVVCVVLTPVALAVLGVTRETLAAGLASGPQAAAPAAPGLAAWLGELVTPNVVQAAADGAMLPVVVFAVLFASALSGVRADRRDAVVRFMEGVADAMQRLVGGVLRLAPYGVFALAVPTASKVGLAAAGALAGFVVLVVVLTVAAIALVLYPVGIGLGRMSPAAFAAYCAPAQALAFASRSSLATMPAAVAAAERADLPPDVSRVVLPLAVTVFHAGTAVAHTVGAVFLATLYGVDLGPAALAGIALATVLTSFAVPGIPGGSIIAMVPVLAVAHVPVAGVGLLLAVDTIPDMFRTTANITGAMSLAAALGARRAA